MRWHSDGGDVRLELAESDVNGEAYGPIYMYMYMQMYVYPKICTYGLAEEEAQKLAVLAGGRAGPGRKNGDVLIGHLPWVVCDFALR